MLHCYYMIISAALKVDNIVNKINDYRKVEKKRYGTKDMRSNTAVYIWHVYVLLYEEDVSAFQVV